MSIEDIEMSDQGVRRLESAAQTGACPIETVVDYLRFGTDGKTPPYNIQKKATQE